jgi:hypothetical protein
MIFQLFEPVSCACSHLVASRRSALIFSDGPICRIRRRRSRRATPRNTHGRFSEQSAALGSAAGIPS